MIAVVTSTSYPAYERLSPDNGVINDHIRDNTPLSPDLEHKAQDIGRGFDYGMFSLLAGVMHVSVVACDNRSSSDLHGFATKSFNDGMGKNEEYKRRVPADLYMFPQPPDVQSVAGARHAALRKALDVYGSELEGVIMLEPEKFVSLPLTLWKVKEWKDHGVELGVIGRDPWDFITTYPRIQHATECITNGLINSELRGQGMLRPMQRFDWMFGIRWLGKDSLRRMVEDPPSGDHGADYYWYLHKPFIRALKEGDAVAYHDEHCLNTSYTFEQGVAQRTYVGKRISQAMNIITDFAHDQHVPDDWLPVQRETFFRRLEEASPKLGFREDGFKELQMEKRVWLNRTTIVRERG